jgi:hypothetical protein
VRVLKLALAQMIKGSFLFLIYQVFLKFRIISGNKLNGIKMRPTLISNILQIELTIF